MNKKLLTLFIVIAMSVGVSSYGKDKPYEGGPVTNGGSIAGVVEAGQRADETMPIKKNKAFCGTTIATEKYVIKGGKVKWAVAMLDGITKGKKMDKKVNLVVDNKNCRFDPHVIVAPKGGTLAVKNSDPMLHNTHFYLSARGKKKNVINLALPKQGQIIKKKKILRKAGLLSVSCDAHDFMLGYVWVLPHPYGAVTDDNGSFKLTDVPAGSYKLKVWHEALGEKVVDVEVEAGKEAKVTVKY